jgi:signal transduction histidine kinase
VVEISSLEQQRIGQELHDDIGQQLTGLGMLAEALAQQLVGEASAHARLAERLAGGLSALRQRARALSRELIPAAFDADGLWSALEGLAAQTAEQAGIDCTLNCTETPSLADNIRAMHLFRIVQEALNNAIRHGRARHVSISATYQKGNLVLSIRDDGTGIRATPDRGEGLGLRIMRNRASLIGGRLSVGPAHEGGTIVACTLPWKDSNPNPNI